MDKKTINDRDERGRFVPGQSGNPGKRFSAGMAEEMQRRSVESRLANRHGKELIRELLARGIKDPSVREKVEAFGFDPDEITNELAMHVRQIEKAQRTGDTKAYAAVMKVAGYDEQNLNLSGDARIALTLNDPNALAGLQSALETGAAPRKPKDEE